MVTYKEYLTESEREFETLFEEFELGMDKINMLFEMTNYELDFACREVEIQAIQESTSFDELQVMYEEAAEEAADKKEGLWQKFCNFISNLWGKFKGLFKKRAQDVKDGEDDNIEIDKAEDETKNLIVRAKDSIVKAVNLACKFNFIDAGKELLNPAVVAITGITAGGVVTGVAAGKIIKNRKKYAEELEDVEGTLEKIKTIFSTTAGLFKGDKKEKDQSDEKKQPGIIRTVINTLSGFFKNALSFLKKMWNKLTNKTDDDNTETDGSENKQGKNKNKNKNNDEGIITGLRRLSDEELKNRATVNKKALNNAKKNNDEKNIKKYERESKLIKEEIARRNDAVSDADKIGKQRDENAKKYEGRDQLLADQQKRNQEAGAKSVSKDAQETKKAELEEKQLNRLKATYLTGTVEMDVLQTSKGSVTLKGKKYKDVTFRKNSNGTVQFLDPVNKTWVDHQLIHGVRPSFKKAPTNVTVLKDKKTNKIFMLDPSTHKVVDIPKKVKGLEDVKFESVEMIWTEAYSLFGESSIDLAIEFTGGDYIPEYITESFIDTEELYGSDIYDESIIKECALIIDEL